MSNDVNVKKRFNKMLEKACEGTSITSKELLRELVISGYKNLYEIDLTHEELKMIVSDLVDGKEISELYSHRSRVRTNIEASD